MVYYVDENGKAIKQDNIKPEVLVNTKVESLSPNGQLTLISNTPTHTTYDLDNEIDKPTNIEFENKNYKFSKIHENCGSVTGEYKEGETHITYVYKLSKQNPVRKSKQKVLSKTGLNAQVLHYLVS